MNAPSRILTSPQITTKRCFLRLLQHYEYQGLQDYYSENSQHLSPWEPVRSPDYFTETAIRERLKASNQAFIQGTGVYLVALFLDDKDEEAEIIGVCNFTNIVRGPFQACHLGYSIADKYQGQGLMSEILQAGISYMFDEWLLHRIMANYMPENARSARLLTSLGFEKEGLAKDYLKIAGQWQDHVLTSKLNAAV